MRETAGDHVGHVQKLGDVLITFLFDSASGRKKATAPCAEGFQKWCLSLCVHGLNVCPSYIAFIEYMLFLHRLISKQMDGWIYTERVLL